MVMPDIGSAWTQSYHIEYVLSLNITVHHVFMRHVFKRLAIRYCACNCSAMTEWQPCTYTYIAGKCTALQLLRPIGSSWQAATLLKGGPGKVKENGQAMLMQKMMEQVLLLIQIPLYHFVGPCNDSLPVQNTTRPGNDNSRKEERLAASSTAVCE